MEWLPKNDGAKQKRFSLFGYLKETKQELKRVTWPTKRNCLKTQV